MIKSGILSGKNYARLQWVAFFQEDDNIKKYQEHLKNGSHLRCRISQKKREESLEQLKEFEARNEALVHEFDDFV